MPLIPTKTIRFNPNWLDADTLRRAGELALREQTRMIQRNLQVDGEAQKKNAPSTMRRKELAGRPQVSLVDKLRRFITRGNWGIETDLANKTVRVYIGPAEYRKIAQYVQEKGYRGWIGVTASARRKCASLFADRMVRSSLKESAARARASK